VFNGDQFRDPAGWVHCRNSIGELNCQTIQRKRLGTLTHLRKCANVASMADSYSRRARLSIDISTEARRRIHIAAARRDQSIREYVWEAVEARLKEDLADEGLTNALVALNERSDPVLADLWNNAKDAAYDKL
jgi:uncharacterized protein (DUF1778 family)